MVAGAARDVLSCREGRILTLLTLSCEQKDVPHIAGREMQLELGAMEYHGRQRAAKRSPEEGTAAGYLAVRKGSGRDQVDPEDSEEEWGLGGLRCKGSRTQPGAPMPIALLVVCQGAAVIVHQVSKSAGSPALSKR